MAGQAERAAALAAHVAFVHGAIRAYNRAVPYSFRTWYFRTWYPEPVHRLEGAVAVAVCRYSSRWSSLPEWS